MSHSQGMLLQLPGRAPAQRPAVQASPTPIVIAFDLETTGIDHTKERIIEVAIINCETGAVFSTLVNPGRTRIKAKITELTTITNAMVTHATVPGFGLAAERIELEIAAWASCRPGAPILLVGHNAKSFDAPFLSVEYKRAGRPLPDAWRFGDSLLLARLLLKKPVVANHKLATLHAHFKFADIGAHRAECDARMVQNVLGVQGLGKLEPDLHARLLRESFPAP
jgi:DNA polymerase-3 subunit epsilon